MAIVGNGDFGVEIQKALGLGGQKVRSIDLHIAVGELVTATVVTLVHDPDTKQIVESISKYKLVDLEERPKDMTAIGDEWQVAVP